MCNENLARHLETPQEERQDSLFGNVHGHVFILATLILPSRPSRLTTEEQVTEHRDKLTPKRHADETPVLLLVCS